MELNKLYNFQRHYISDNSSKKKHLVVCTCGENHMLYDSHHDEVFCLKCGAVIMRNGIFESRINIGELSNIPKLKKTAFID